MTRVRLAGDADSSLDLAGSRLLRTFDGLAPTPAVLEAIATGAASGVTLFRHRNVESPAQLRELAARLQAARPAGDPPLVVGLDQEGGQLQAVGDPATAWPGNLALGATGSEELAEACGRAIGAEAAAMGATLVFAPVCDVLQPASATPVGTRSFGDDPERVGRLAAALARGLQASGVAAVLKHFPGHGSASGDSHLGLPIVADPADVIRRRDLAPFGAGIEAGAAAVMPGHLAAPALTGGRSIAATVSRELLVGVLRDELRFEGVTISDALDMGGATAIGGLDRLAVEACRAGVDLLLLVHPADVEAQVLATLRTALASGDLPAADAVAATARIRDLRSRLGAGPPQPDLGVVGCAAHRDLARRIAEASVTLVRDPSGLLPRRAGSGRRISLFAPEPVDLTPAESSSYLRLGLAGALRDVGFSVAEHVVPLDPTSSEVAELAAIADAAARGEAGRDAAADLAVVATFDAIAHPGQVDLVTALAGRVAAGAGRLPVVAIALRSPYDAGRYPAGVTSICSYGIQAPQMVAVARAIAGEIPFAGRLPVELPVVSPR